MTEPRDRREGDRRMQDSLASDVAELKDAVVGLTGRTEQLAKNLGDVNEIQRKQQEVDRRSAAAVYEAAMAIQKVTDLDKKVIPREEHEQKWREEQAELIALRLRIKRRGFLQALGFFIASMVVFVITIIVVYQSNQKANDQQRRACQERVLISTQALPQYEKLLTSPTINDDPVLKGFIQLARDNSLKGSKVNCG